jgi:hypothetical protein
MSYIDTLREYKIGGFVIFDYIATLFAAYAASQFFNISILLAFIILFIISIPAHYYYGVKTRTNYYLGLTSSKPPQSLNNIHTYDELQTEDEPDYPSQTISTTLAPMATSVATGVATSMATSAVTAAATAALL